jgi:hypothetical protein
MFVQRGALTIALWHVWEGSNVPEKGAPPLQKDRVDVFGSGSLWRGGRLNQSFAISPDNVIVIPPDLILSNPSGDNLTIYRVLDHGGGTGHLTVGGTVEPDGQWIRASANWSNVQYVGGSSAGADSLRVEAYDATTHAWVASSYFKATTTTSPSPIGVQDHQGLEPSASIIGIQDHQGLEHQTVV